MSFFKKGKNISLLCYFYDNAALVQQTTNNNNKKKISKDNYSSAQKCLEPSTAGKCQKRF